MQTKKPGWIQSLWKKFYELFIDNTPSHPESFIDCFSHVKIVFLPKNTTSKLQPLDAGIIKNFKVLYPKQLLQYVLAKIKPGSNASDVISSVDLLKSIGWVMDAWRKVKKRNNRQLLF